MGQQIYHEDSPYPILDQVPENAEPERYGDGSEEPWVCPKCVTIEMKLEKNYYVCPQCNSRYSMRKKKDKGWSSYAEQPGLLDWQQGSNSNPVNATPYHTEIPDSSNFSNMLGK